MIVFIDLEHERLQSFPPLWADSRQRIDTIHDRLVEISGDTCQVIRYDEINSAQIGELSPRAIAVSGCFTDYEHYHPLTLAGLRALYQSPVFGERRCPIIGFCAGMQLMAETHGATLGPIASEKLTCHTPSSEHPYSPDIAQEHGFLPIEITVPSHPLVAELSSTPVVFQAHYWEVKTLPDGFENLARSPLTPIQMIAHRTLPLYGTQFHTEQYNAENPDGKRILENFFHFLT